jgi:hypothetical protein
MEVPCAILIVTLLVKTWCLQRDVAAVENEVVDLHESFMEMRAQLREYNARHPRRVTRGNVRGIEGESPRPGNEVRGGS